MPTGATDPKAYAVIGLVKSTAPTDAANSRAGANRRAVGASTRDALCVPRTAATESHAPTDTAASGSRRRTANAAVARTALNCG
jgi:hypothetical protein